MRKTKCIKCESELFELAEITPTNSDTKLVLVQCSKCGTPVGAIDQYDVGNLVRKIAMHLGVSIN